MLVDYREFIAVNLLFNFENMEILVGVKMSGHYNLASWNVNGLRAIMKKGFLDLLLEQRFDILCIQETKVSPDKLPREAKNIPGYYNYFVSAEQYFYAV